jgi:signal transduction histidine kinase
LQAIRNLLENAWKYTPAGGAGLGLAIVKELI